MLQDGIRAGVPGAFIPILCLAITGGANLTNTAGVPEVIQQYLANVTGGYKIPPPAGSGPETVRNPPAPSQPGFGPQVLPPTSQPTVQTQFPSFPGVPNTPRASYSAPSGQRGQSLDNLPRLTTASSNLVPNTAAVTTQVIESPIYFHHWTPPTSQTGPPVTATGGTVPQTPTGKLIELETRMFHC